MENTTVYLIRHSETMKSENLIYTFKAMSQLNNEKLPLSKLGEKKLQN